MRWGHQSNKLIITGVSGTGKSTYAERFLVNAYRREYNTLFIYDWQGEFSQRLRVAPCLSIEQLELKAKEGIVCFDPSQEFEGQAYEGLQFFADWSFQVSKLADMRSHPDLARYPRMLVVDEMQLLTGTAGIPHEVQTVTETGRRWGLDFLLISQQINQLHNTLRNQATEVVTFRHEDRYILDVMEELGFDRQQVSTLTNPGGFLCRDRRRSKTTQGNLFGGPVFSLDNSGGHDPRLASDGAESVASGPGKPPTAEAPQENNNG